MKLSRLLRRPAGQVAEARRAAEEGAAQAALSADRQQQIRTTVVAPLRAASAHNQFAEMLRQSLIEDRR
jgi:hypothetical protein